ncbi:MAG TPA: TIGR02444 family protein, partial [Caulobacteraceae bacterium]|nr:TIGR02444 family protein [Caulobacteraceae bacterium]
VLAAGAALGSRHWSCAGDGGRTSGWRDRLSGGALWSFAIERYGRPGVEAAMLQAQDVHGHSAAYLLWAVWLAETGRGSDPVALAAGAGLARAWQDTAIAPLRDLRRRLKAAAPPTPDDARERLRKGVAQLELEAERMLLEMLEASSPAATGLESNLHEALAMAARAWGAELPPSDLDNMVKLAG